MADVSLILAHAHSGDPKAAADLLTLVYDELRRLAAHKLAQENPGQTLQATALVHEAYLRLIGPGANPEWEHRGHFFAAAAEAMRRILVDKARQKKAQKHGGGMAKAELADIAAANHDPFEVIAVHEALEELAAKSHRKAELVKLRYFLGCTIAEAAGALDIAHATAEEDWTFAKAFLRRYWLRAEGKKAEK
jgi:RNA polymerase sigma factor (TIGR02999 family)